MQLRWTQSCNWISVKLPKAQHMGTSTQIWVQVWAFVFRIFMLDHLHFCTVQKAYTAVFPGVWKVTLPPTEIWKPFPAPLCVFTCLCCNISISYLSRASTSQWHASNCCKSLQCIFPFLFAWLSSDVGNNVDIQSSIRGTWNKWGSLHNSTVVLDVSWNLR